VEPLLARIKEAGYHGVETHLPFDRQQKSEFLRLLKEYDLQLIAQHWAADGRTVEAYLKDFEKHINNAAESEALFINSQTGKDFFTFDENVRVIETANLIASRTGVKILHETHRGKFSFHSRTIVPYLDRFPELRLTADFSHWCNVSESYLQDQPELVRRGIERTDHIHSRVGHPQSPQVSDPRAPEWKEALNYHLVWWRDIVALHQATGAKSFTITTEFGPDPYMPSLPFTRQPVSSQWEINLYMKDYLTREFSSDN
jgi:hypothetical protein